MDIPSWRIYSRREIEKVGCCRVGGVGGGRNSGRANRDLEEGEEEGEGGGVEIDDDDDERPFFCLLPLPPYFLGKDNLSAERARNKISPNHSRLPGETGFPRSPPFPRRLP